MSIFASVTQKPFVFDAFRNASSVVKTSKGTWSARRGRQNTTIFFTIRTSRTKRSTTSQSLKLGPELRPPAIRCIVLFFSDISLARGTTLELTAVKVRAGCSSRSSAMLFKTEPCWSIDGLTSQLGSQRMELRSASAISPYQGRNNQGQKSAVKINPSRDTS